MIHRAMFGSYERFIGILIEHYAGELPLWLAPRAGDRAAGLRPLQRLRRVASETSCASSDIRVELDDRSESIGRKIRDAELRKIPYMLIVGEREEERRTVSVREHHGAQEGDVPSAQVRRAPAAASYTRPR